MLVVANVMVSLMSAAFLPPPHLHPPPHHCKARCRVVLQQSPEQSPPPRSYVKGVPERVQLLLQDLAAAGASKVQVVEAFEEAVELVFAPPKQQQTPTEKKGAESTAAPAKAELGELKPPATASAAQQAFRAAYAKFKRPPVLSVTQKFLNTMIEDRSCVFRFEYNAIYALGFTALCDAFLRQSCKTPEDEAATRSSLCWALGLDEAQVAADAEALRASTVGMSRDDLFATEMFTKLAGAPAARPFKYTYAFGVGLVLLMYAVGETKISSRDRLKYGAKFKDVGDEKGAAEQWCTALNLRFADTLDRDYVRPLSIDGIGRFAFESETGLEDASAVLSSIGVQGSF